MTKRKLLAIFFALAIGVSLLACGNQSESAVKSEIVVQAQSDISQQSGKFVLVSKNSFENSFIDYYIFYDPDTLVMYSYMTGNRAGGMTRLDNPDGTPKLYSPDSKTE